MSISMRWWQRRRTLIDSDGKQNIPPWWAGYSGLFITVVTPAVSNIDTSVFHMIDQAVLDDEQSGISIGQKQLMSVARYSPVSMRICRACLAYGSTRFTLFTSLLYLASSRLLLNFMGGYLYSVGVTMSGMLSPL